MGDMADFANDRCMDNVIGLHEHADAGFPTDQDSYEAGFIDEMGTDTYTDGDFNIPQRSGFGGGFVPVPTETKVTCKNCQEGGLSWSKTAYNKWWMREADGEWHVCKGTTPQPGAEVKEVAKGKFYHVFTTDDGIKLYAKKRVRICDCDGTTHEAGHGCS